MLKGVDNGYLRRVSSFSGNKIKSYFGKAIATIQSTYSQGDVVVRIKARELPESTVTITCNNK